MIKDEMGKRLRELRLQCKMTQQQVADKMGVAQPVYQRFEKGVYECSSSSFAACARFSTYPPTISSAAASIEMN